VWLAHSSGWYVELLKNSFIFQRLAAIPK
jgi:hypothetical protein